NHYKADEGRPERKHVQDWERHVWRSDLNRQNVVSEAALRRRGQHEEHHDGAVHSQQAEISLRLDLAYQRQAHPRPDHVDAHQQREKHSHKHRREREEEILKPNNFVIEAENVLANETLRGRMSVRVLGNHLLFLRLPCRQPFVEIFLADNVYHAMHLVVTEAAEFGAGNFVIANGGRSQVQMKVQSWHCILLESQVRNKEAVNHVHRAQAEINLAVHRHIHRSGNNV